MATKPERGEVGWLCLVVSQGCYEVPGSQISLYFPLSFQYPIGGYLIVHYLCTVTIFRIYQNLDAQNPPQGIELNLEPDQVFTT